MKFTWFWALNFSYANPYEPGSIDANRDSEQSNGKTADGTNDNSDEVGYTHIGDNIHKEWTNSGSFIDADRNKMGQW